MKITRLQKGYRVNLSDGEFEALTRLVELGLSDIEGDRDSQVAILSLAGRRAMNGTFGDRYAMSIAEDRRRKVDDLAAD